MEKSCRKCTLKASSRPIFHFCKQPKTAIAYKKLFKNRIIGKGIIKNLDFIWWNIGLTLSFLLNPVPFNGQSYKKQIGPGNRDHSLFGLRKKFTKISLLVIYYLTKFDAVI